MQALVIFCSCLLFAALAMAEAPKTDTHTVLFVCEHGSAKSVVAAAHFNAAARKAGLPFRAISRGTDPDAELAPPAVTGLTGDGLPIPEEMPKLLSQQDLDQAAAVVTFCDLPSNLSTAVPVHRWEVPPVSTEYAASRDAMIARIDQLLRELQEKP